MNRKFKALLLGIGVSLLTTTLPATTQAHVLDGAKEYNNHYYKIMNIRMKWEEASDFCKSTGGHLATAESAEENEMLKQMVMGSGISERFWIGGYRTDKNLWKWVTGKTFGDYFDWARGKERPWNAGGGPRLSLSYEAKGQWDNLKPSSERPFICEWEAVGDAHDSTL